MQIASATPTSIGWALMQPDGNIDTVLLNSHCAMYSDAAVSLIPPIFHQPPKAETP